MPLLTAITAVSGVLWRLLGYNSHDDMRKRKIVAKTYDSEFVHYFDNILALLEGRKVTTPRLKTAYDHLAESMKYNLLTTREMTRGLMVVNTLSQLCGYRTLSSKEKHLAFTLGWCIEIVETANMIADDIVDDCDTRAAKPCWYKQKHVGMIAVNDSFWLISSIYVLLNAEFRDHPYYTELVDLFHLVVEYSEIGGMLSGLVSDSKTDLNNFTEENLQNITRYKTGYFCFYLPLMATLYLAGIDGRTVNEEVLAISLELGEFYQNQVDYNRCYEALDVASEDIKAKKCTWLIVEAVRRADTKQRAILEANYGRSDEGCVEKVKEVFESLNLRHLYSEYKDQSYRTISDLIDEHSRVLPAHVFMELRDTIYMRKH